MEGIVGTQEAGYFQPLLERGGFCAINLAAVMPDPMNTYAAVGIRRSPLRLSRGSGYHPELFTKSFLILSGTISASYPPPGLHPGMLTSV
jgi:hypothetical protein